MGLDMYLERCNRKAWGFRGVDIDKAKTDNPKLYEELKPFIHKRGGEIYSWESIFEEIGYWRKANAIHKWFVDNAQDGVDDCDYYEVSKEQLEDLLDTCIQVRDASMMKHGWVNNGQRFENGMWCPIFEEGEVIVDTTVAEALLPTQSGFFFGGTDYDQWYMEDIMDTIEIITKVLETTDFALEMVFYSSSW